MKKLGPESMSGFKKISKCLISSYSLNNYGFDKVFRNNINWFYWKNFNYNFYTKKNSLSLCLDYKHLYYFLNRIEFTLLCVGGEKHV